MKKSKSILSHFLCGILLCLLFVNNASSQNRQKIDSLKNLIKTVSDTELVNVYIALSWKYSQVAKYDTSLGWSRKALQISDSIGFPIGGAKALHICGIVYNEQGKYKKAQETLDSALMLATKGGRKNLIAYSYGLLVTNAFYQENFEKALELQIKAIKMLEGQTDKNQLGASYNRLAGIYSHFGNNEKALEYLQMALEIYKQTGHKKGSATIYNNLGLLYGDIKDYEKELSCHLQALRLREELTDQFGMAESTANIGIVQLNLKNYPNALENLLKSLSISETIGHKAGMANCYNYIGKVYLLQNKFAQAREYYEKDLALSKTIGQECLKNAYSGLSDLYAKQGDYKNALEYFKEFTTLKDSAFSDESSKNIAKMQVQYESEKKDNEIKLLNKDKEKQIALAAAESSRLKFITGAVTIGLLLMLAFALFIFRSYRQKRLVNLNLSRAYAQLEQKNKQITDSIFYASRIQQAILPPEKTVKEIFPQSFIFFQPKDIVSGDFYWMEKKGDRVFLAVADCTGHGVPGAFMSMIGNTLLNEIVNEKHIFEPAKILHELNAGIMHALHQDQDNLHSQDDGMDISICMIDKNKKEIVFAGAGHHLFLMNDAGSRLVSGDPFSIGKIAGEQRAIFSNQTLEIANNTTLYLFSDGYPDQFGGELNKKFGSADFENLMSSLAILGMDEQKEKIDSEFNAWKGSRRQTDDVCVMGIKLSH